MGWPPDKYRAAISNSLEGARRALDYSTKQINLMEVNSEDDRESLRDIVEKLERLLLNHEKWLVCDS